MNRIKPFAHRSPRRWLALLLLLTLGIREPSPAFSQTKTRADRPANRWLIILETSRAMQPRATASAQIAANLVLAGMSGQLRAGDTLGLWTYDSELHAGSFPLQTVTADNTKTIAEHIASFVAQQKFTSRASRDTVFPLMNTVISNSEFITVILISSGSETFTGTPFDKAINAIHKQWQAQQEKAHLPFLTMLRAQQGRITDFEVSRPPGALAFPPLPPELLIPEVVATKSAPPKPVSAPTVAVVPNLILHGKKSEPEVVISTNPLPAVVEKMIPPPAPTALPARTNVTAQAKVTPVPAPTATAVPAPRPATILPTTSVRARATTNVPPLMVATLPTAKNNFWQIGVMVVGALVGLVFLLIRRSRSQPRVSLITRSLDRDKK